MKSVTIAALAALVSTGAQAVPFGGHVHNHAGRHAALHHHQKRDIVWFTEYEVETVTVMKTVYGDGSQPTGTPDTVYPQSPQHLEPTSDQYPPSPPQPTTPTKAAVTLSTTQSPPPARTTTSSYVAPPAPEPEPTTTTKTSTYQAPTPPPATTAAPTTPPAPPAPPAPSSTYGSGGSSGATGTSPGASYSGDATYYDPGLGACGLTSTPQDDIVAISWELFGSGGNPNANPLCGRTVTITGVDGKSYTAKVVDRCTGCKAADLDMTVSLFNKVTNNGDGRVHNMKWTWN